MFPLIAASCGLVVPAPTVVQYMVTAAGAAAVQPAAHSIFPTTDILAGETRTVITSFDDELEKIAAEQRARDAQIDAQVRAHQPVLMMPPPFGSQKSTSLKSEPQKTVWQKAAIKARQEAQERAEQEEFLAQERKEAERKAKAEKAAAQAMELREARAAAAAERAEREAEMAARSPSTKAKTDKYDTVQKVSARAERIAARQAAGEEAPSLFSF